MNKSYQEIDKIFNNINLSSKIKLDIYLQLNLLANKDLVDYIEEKYTEEIYSYLKKEKNCSNSNDKYDFNKNIILRKLIYDKYYEIKNRMSSDMLSALLISIVPLVYSKL